MGDVVNSCTAPVAAGGCLLTLNTVGVRSLTAVYAGDANFVGSTSSSVTHTVEKAATTTVITSDLSIPSVVGQPVTVAFQVTSSGGTPAGTVTVSDGAISCNATVAVGNCSLTFATAGPRNITATYAGNANFLTSASAPTAHGVSKAATTTGISTHTPNPSSLGAAVAVTWAVGVTAPGAGTPTGNVTVGDGVDDCTAAVGAGGCSVTLSTPGTRSLTAVYAGDADFAGSTSPSVGHTVSLAATTTTITADLPDPSTVGQTVPVTFTVTATVGTPTGNVTVSDGVGTQCIGTVAAGTCDLIFTTAGPRNLVANYAGDVAFAASASTPAAHTVTPATTTTTIVSDLPDPSVFGEPVTVIFTVVSAGGTPTGNVTVSGGGTSCQASVAVGSCQLTFPAIGSKTLTANYPGDGNFTGSTSGSVGHTVNQASTTTAITDHTPEPSALGAPVTVTWTVSPTAPGDGTPGGTVTVSDGLDSCIAAVAVGGCDITLSTVGTRPLTATYSGDASFTGSASSVVNHSVSAAASTTTITSDTPDPSVTGDSVTVTFTVTGSAGTATGNVTVSDGAGTSCIGTVATGSCKLAFLTAGARSLTATYAGDVTYNGSVSAAEPHAVNPAATTTGLTSSANPSVFGQLVTFTATVTGPGGTPTGTVQFKDGAGDLGAPVALNGSGEATYSTSALSVAGHGVTAVYGGDPNYATSTSSPVNQVVNQAATTTSIDTHTPDPVLAGGDVTVTWSVTPTLPGAGSPTGTVTVTTDGAETCSDDVAVGSCTLIFTTPGARTLTASYGGDTNFALSASAAEPHTVN